MSDRPASAEEDTREVLGDLLGAIRFRAEVFFRGTLCDDWSLDTSGSGRVAFHVVARGRCWMHLHSRHPVALQEGDVVVLPHDAAHVVSPTPQTPPAFGERRLGRHLPFAANKDGTGLICGHMEVDTGARRLLLAALPDFVIARPDTGADGREIRRLLDVLLAEAAKEAPGTNAILDRLSDALLFYVIRMTLSLTGQRSGLIAALADPRIGQAVAAVCRGEFLELSPR
jgi:hypothetical protein